MGRFKMNNHQKAPQTLSASQLNILCEQASILLTTGQVETARKQFLDILKIDPTHLETLINFAVLLVDTGYNSAAKTAYSQALACHPHSLLAHINLANLYFQERHFKEASNHYEKVLAIANSKNKNDKSDSFTISQVAHAHQGLALINFEQGNQERADFHHSSGFTLEPIRFFDQINKPKSKSALVLIGGRGGDIPWPSLIDQSLFSVQTLAVEFWQLAKDLLKPLDQYDLILNAIGDADSSKISLLVAQDFFDKQINSIPSFTSFYSNNKIINSPDKVLLSGRTFNAERFKKIHFVKTANTRTLNREDLKTTETIKDALTLKVKFPVLVRSLGFQTGKHFEYASTPEDLSNIASSLPGAELLVMEFLDTKDERGYFKKYRVMFIGGNIYPLHLAISKHWKVHYFSAAMKDSAENRDQEKAFLERMEETIGAKALKALESIQRELALDYAGIDFAIDAQGELVVFEANATMIMALPPADEIWDYRRGHILKAKEAVSQMLLSKAHA